MSTNRIKKIYMLAFFLCAGLAFSAEPRVWTLGDGTRMEAEFYNEVFGDVMVKDLKGNNHLIRVEDLSDGDLRYVEQHVPPEVSARMDHKTRMLPKTEWSREDDDTTLYTFEVALKKESKLPYQGSLTAELFVLGKERAVEGNRHCVLMHYAKKQFTFPAERNGVFEFSIPDIKFNAYRANWVKVQRASARGKNYLGYILTVADPTGHIIYIDDDIANFDWLTDDILQSTEKLRKLYAEHPGSPESRHFNDTFQRVSPPRIPWFQRDHSR